MRSRFAQALKEQLKFVDKQLPRELGIQFMPLGTEKELKEQIIAATLDRTCLFAPLPESDKEFEVRVAAAKAKVVLVAQEIARLLGTILAEYGVAQKKLVAMQKVLPQACADISAQLAALLAKGLSQGGQDAAGQGARRCGARCAAHGRLAGIGPSLGT